MAAADLTAGTERTASVRCNRPDFQIIEKGLLAGLEGTLARDATAWRVVVSINALQRSVAVQVDRDMISPENPMEGLRGYQQA